MNRYLVDTDVFLYARGTIHHYREPCRAVLRGAARGDLGLDASVEVVQEFAHVLLRRGVDRLSALQEVDEVRSQCRLHAFNIDVHTQVLALLRAYDSLGVRDAVHAATAVHAGLTAIVSTDRVFDVVEEVTRVDPATPDAPWFATA